MAPKAATKKVTDTTTTTTTNEDKKLKSKQTTNTTANTTANTTTNDNVTVSAKKETKVRAKKDTTTTPVDTNTAPTDVTTTDTSVTDNVILATDTSETSITDNFTEFIAKFQNILSQLSSLKSELKNIERKTVKQLKVVQKIHNKKKRKGTRAPSGFVKPSLISDELATFLGKTKGSEMARTDVTREINKYIRANNLQDKENGRKINPDAQLKALLKIDDEVALTYLNLQRYMGPHFPKQTKAPEVTA